MTERKILELSDWPEAGEAPAFKKKGRGWEIFEKRLDALHDRENLHATVDGEEFLKGISLTIASGKIHAIMGPNGSGKSTLSSIFAGRPGREVQQLSTEFAVGTQRLLGINLEGSVG